MNKEKTELIYLWIEQDEHGCFQNMEFNFSPCYKINFNYKTRKLTAQKIDKLNVFSESKIQNLTAIIGENGVGKTTLIKYLTELGDVPYSQRDSAEKRQKRRERTDSFIVVYKQAWTDSLKIINHLSGCRKIQFEGNEINVYSGNEFVTEDYIGKISHICLSNSEYGIVASGNRMNSGIDYITLTNSALPTIYKDFYRRLYGVDVESFLVELTRFNTLQRYMADKAEANDFQVFLDVLYYDSLLKGKSRFCGKKIDAVDFSISILEAPISEKSSSEAEIMIKNGMSKCKTLKNDLCEMGLWGRLVYNLAMELTVVYDDFKPETKKADEIFSYCKSFVTDKDQGRERTYYLDAWHEVDEFKTILENAKKGDNGLSKTDLARVDYATAPVESFQIILNDARKGHAFVLKYLVVLNLGMSSGERALLNIMSRICFASQIENYMPGKGIHWNTNILLLIDEIDLYLHPEWQRRIVRDLLSLLRRQFKGHYFQIILTSHSPIVLSDIPVENCIFLKKRSDGTVCQEKRNAQTFGANIYTLYKDAFFLSDDKLAMGEFAQNKINQWIDKIETGKFSEEEANKIIGLIGEPLVRRNVEKMVRRQYKKLEPVKGRESIHSEVTEEKKKMIEFLERQKAEIEKQIRMLRGM